jgi:hypothetical protein
MRGEPSFQWYRASIGLSASALVPVLLGVRRNLELAAFDSSPFAEPWSLCDRVAFGWPLHVLRRAVDSTQQCIGLPNLDWVALVLDVGFVGGLALTVGLLCGGFKWRRFLGIERKSN